MASAPAFATTPRIGFGSVTAANTNRDGTGTIVDVLTGVAAGTRIERIVLKATGDPADSVVTIFLNNGTTYLLFDEFDLGDPAAASTTVAGYRIEKAYSDLVLPTASWKLAAAITVALTSGAINVFAFGADLT
jgi:hypothetical protein